MSDLKKYEGVIPAFYACYDDQGEVSPERTRALVQYFIDKGVQGLYVNGSSGECIYQSVEDRKLILEEVMAVRYRSTGYCAFSLLMGAFSKALERLNCKG